MDSAIIAAIIGAVGAVIVALIAKNWSSNSNTSENDPSVSIGQKSTDGSNYAAGRDLNVEINHDVRLLSKKANRLVTQSSLSEIGDNSERWEWASFDANFLSLAIKDSPRGWLFDGYAVDHLRKKENADYIRKSALVYLKAALLCESESSKEYEALNKLAQIFVAESQLDAYK